MICVSIRNKSYQEILRILDNPQVEMAEIRLDLCELSDMEIQELFGGADTPLVATCRGDADTLAKAIRAGARFADLEIEAPVGKSRLIQKLCREYGTELIRSFHDFESTPDDEILHKVLARCFRYGAEIAKIVTKCNSEEDAERIQSLYSIILEDVDSLQGKLIAFGMGAAGRNSRLDCLKRGAPFTYASLSEEETVAEGQWPLSEIYPAVYKNIEPYFRTALKMPASKSFAQRAIIAAALAEGTSHLSAYTPCGDSESAIRIAEAIGAKVTREEDSLVITGIGPSAHISPDTLDVGESGLLARLMIPIAAATGNGSVSIEGEGTLPGRPLAEAAGIMASFGVLLSGDHVPLTVKGKLIPGTADIDGKGGSQLISGLLMALPLCGKDSTLFVNEPKSIPYMYITLDVLRHFGVQTRSEMEGDAEMLELQDWTYCSGISFKIRGGQKYRAADFTIEGDWSAAANFLVAGAVFGSVEIEGLDTKTLQADLAIIDILVEAGAVVSQLEDDTICVRKAPLEAFSADLNHAPDLFPIVSVLAAFCAGESRISGIGRLAGKESNRAEAIIGMLVQMGVEARIDGDELVVFGETLCSRLVNGRLLNGGDYTSRHDHRMVMALHTAALGASSPIIIDDEDCVAKSFPGFVIYANDSREC
ncbi:MAG: 3-phosphoshikimate 1-carboxyvinyltransferase [Bacteroidales bacterium]|nr:3-phosphoshikimate 1-carboxyvinyltransferase [Bacteroidales bacterium]